MRRAHHKWAWIARLAESTLPLASTSTSTSTPSFHPPIVARVASYSSFWNEFSQGFLKEIGQKTRHPSSSNPSALPSLNPTSSFALQLLTAPSAEAAKSLLSTELSVDDFVQQMRAAIALGRQLGPALRRMVPVPIEESLKMAERTILVADHLSAQDKEHMQRGTLSARHVMDVASRSGQEATLVLQLYGTYDLYAATLREVKARLARGEKVHGMQPQEALAMVESCSHASKARMMALMTEVKRGGGK